MRKEPMHADKHATTDLLEVDARAEFITNHRFLLYAERVSQRHTVQP
jgi:hypothetical protein